MQPTEYLELIDWRRRVAELFVELRQRDAARSSTLTWFRARKDALYRTHPRSPLPAEARSGFAGLSYWPHDPEARVSARFRPDPATESTERTNWNASEAAPRRIGRLEFVYRAREHSLAAYWMEGYAGGLFVPFRDATSGRETYGGGRYALDTIKSADLGSTWETSGVILDFNYAYHPSCVFSARWTCPLAPPENTLSVAIEAGEKLTRPD